MSELTQVAEVDTKAELVDNFFQRAPGEVSPAPPNTAIAIAQQNNLVTSTPDGLPSSVAQTGDEIIEGEFVVDYTPSPTEVRSNVEGILAGTTDFNVSGILRTLDAFVGGRDVSTLLREEPDLGPQVLDFIKKEAERERAQSQAVLQLTKTLEPHNDEIANLSDVAEISDIKPEDIASVVNTQAEIEVVSTDGKKLTFTRGAALAALLLIDVGLGGGSMQILSKELSGGTTKWLLAKTGFSTEQVEKMMKTAGLEEEFLQSTDNYGLETFLKSLEEKHQRGDKKVVHKFLDGLKQYSLFDLVQGQRINTKRGFVQLTPDQIKRYIFDKLTQDEMNQLNIRDYQPKTS